MKNIVICLFGLLLGPAVPVHAEVKLAGMFNDNMILQRETSAPIWGTADPDERITLTLEDQKIVATAGTDGNWKMAFKGLKPGSPFTLMVAGKSNTITINNVAVGDIWVASGQSNMEFRLAEKDEIAAANIPDFRYLDVPNVSRLDRITDLTSAWKVTTPATAGAYSAVAYYFAQNIHQELRIPIGVIRCGWSGMPIEPFIAMEDLESVPGLKEKSDTVVQKFKNVPIDAAKFPIDLKVWQEKYGRTDTENKGFAAKWADPTFDDHDWITTNTPGDWTKVGVPNGGVIWVRKTVQLPPEAAGKDFNFTPGLVRDTATVYFNGEVAGSLGGNPPYFWNVFSASPIPGRLVKAGTNVIALRIVTQKQKNYSFAPGSHLGFRVADPKSVSDDWLAKVETEYPPLSADALSEFPQPPIVKMDALPSVIFNGMIYPITSYGIKGALWYQGESNAPNPWAYRTLLPLLIKSWRNHWNIGDFPFYIVQLPNYGTPPKAPGEGDLRWAQMREAELLTWQTVPNTGTTVNIDIGVGGNLHPPDKKDVGYRLSLFALANTYGRKIEYSGPIYDSMAVEGAKIRVKFTHLGGGLVAKNGALQQFVICGADRVWRAGDAVIDGDSVVISSADVAAPVAVRYAWANDPEGCNLYSQAGLPASPFRTDTWPVDSQDKW